MIHPFATISKELHDPSSYLKSSAGHKKQLPIVRAESDQLQFPQFRPANPKRTAV
ncbi:hypothetical protein NEUTE1DRAFT_105909 [Neurospora tetrasperma FGSC 2508]|uniref:Uncharacterized protein n=1 Tax=Neurospora tetrasperma (strain FGSC 2508 / ATCC MYA-4615 / P0657) TaxID=510951 RepID=F8N0D2_NEUT8|nr:uncharacterized protein NEUTE1DRAFT_105909 [Neurospora tetrasperma FGSC 2508]EGO52960.1 hypothetical protein NEUTE1DRAFT_105909 [Neurospora tetrasperma FGSC 2508]